MGLGALLFTTIAVRNAEGQTFKDAGVFILGVSSLALGTDKVYFSFTVVE
jgi:hypothetical protein